LELGEVQNCWLSVGFRGQSIVLEVLDMEEYI